MLAACRAEATLGEICDALRAEWGEYREPARSEPTVSLELPRSFGVEEELVLVDPVTRRAHRTVGPPAKAANDSAEEVALELFLHQVEPRRRPARCRRAG